MCNGYRIAGLVLLAAVPSTASGMQGSAGETLQLLPGDGALNDNFGGSVAISGSIAIVGSREDDDNGSGSGSAYLFDTTTGAELFKLLASDGDSSDEFGYSVAISGATALVGAWENDDNLADSGSAYLFDTSTGLEIAKLLPNDGAAQDNFGRAVAISGTTAIVGAWLSDSIGFDSGAAYLFDATTGLQLLKLVANDGAPGDRFGVSVGISGTIAIVGADSDDDLGTSSGSAYLFDTTTGVQLAKLLASDGATGDEFGLAVAISGTTAIVGSWLDDDLGTNSGSAYLFDAITGLELFKLLPIDGEDSDVFGTAVAISGTNAVVGAYLSDDLGTASGSAYLFDASTGQQVCKLLPSDGATRDDFGIAVGVSGTSIVVGALLDDNNGLDSGSAYVFTSSASVTFRNAGTNPISFTTTPPILGQTAVATVDLSLTGHSLALIVGYASPLNFQLSGGQTLLINIADPAGELLSQVLTIGPLATINLPVPASATLCGLAASLQALHVGGVTPYALSNAQDIVLGF